MPAYHVAAFGLTPLLFLIGCGAGEPSAPGLATEASEEQAPTRLPNAASNRLSPVTMLTALNDAQIVGALLATNDGEMAVAQLAKLKTVNPDVAALADDTNRLHADANAAVRTFAAEAGIASATSSAMWQVEVWNEETMGALHDLTPSAFDGPYVSSQIRTDTETLGLFDDTLLGAARSAALRSLLLSNREMTATHLARVQAMATRLALPR
jgi:putative membrane protein